MEVCYWALLFMPLVIFHHLLNVFVQLANKRGLKQMFMFYIIGRIKKTVIRTGGVQARIGKVHLSNVSQNQ
jgi:hypothetical protein